VAIRPSICSVNRIPLLRLIPIEGNFDSALMQGKINREAYLLLMSKKKNQRDERRPSARLSVSEEDPFIRFCR